MRKHLIETERIAQETTHQMKNNVNITNPIYPLVCCDNR